MGQKGRTQVLISNVQPQPRTSTTTNISHFRKVPLPRQQKLGNNEETDGSIQEMRLPSSMRRPTSSPSSNHNTEGLTLITEKSM